MTHGPNLDANDRLVKRGAVVVWYGWRADVLKVRTGRCLVQFKHLWPSACVGGRPELPKWLLCTSVQVVAL